MLISRGFNQFARGDNEDEAFIFNIPKQENVSGVIKIMQAVQRTSPMIDRR